MFLLYAMDLLYIIFYFGHWYFRELAHIGNEGKMGECVMFALH